MKAINPKYKKVDLPKAFALLIEMRDENDWIDTKDARKLLVKNLGISHSLARCVVWHFNNGWE